MNVVPSGSVSTSSLLLQASTPTRALGNSTSLPQAQHHDAHELWEGSQNCLCVVCHLKATIFPRRPDGRIVLPAPWVLASNLNGEREETWSHIPEVAGCDSYSLHISEGVSMQNVDTDGGKGTMSVLHLSGPGVAPSKTLPSLPADLNTPVDLGPKLEPYRPHGTPDGAGLEQFESSLSPGIDPSAIYLYPPGSGSSLAIPRPSIGSPSQDSQPRMPTSPTFATTQLENRIPDLSTTPRLLSQEYGFTPLSTSKSGSASASQPSPFHQWHLVQNEIQSSSCRTQRPSYRHKPCPHARDTTHSKPNSASQNLRKVLAVPFHLPRLTSAPSSSSFTWRADGPTITSVRPASQVELKWNAERKKRQRYFSHSLEKSNFRLYSL